MQNYLKETLFLDYNAENFDEFLIDLPVYSNKQSLAIHLYDKVRESFIYDPYHLDIRFEGLKASSIILKKRAWCVEKAILLAALARKVGIPSKLGYAIVVNHIGVEKLKSYLKRDEIVFHGYVELYINNKWIKCTPSFDSRICKLSKVSVLEWDGQNDSLFQAFEGEMKFMEYIHDYGSFEDVPIELMNSEMKKYYPHLFEKLYDTKEFSFHHL